MPLRQLPRNGTDRTRVLVSLDGEIRNLAADSALADVPVESADPIREFYAWTHKRNYEGFWFSTTIGAHVRFESLLERQYLLSADHDPSVVSLSAQPFALLWPAKTASDDGKSLHSHVPDYFYRYANGDGGLVDVRRPDKADDPHFTLTCQFCASIGWHYSVFTGLESPQAETLDWLSGYRMDRFAPAADTRSTILNSFSPESSLRSGVHAASRHTGLLRDIVLGTVLHLLFHGHLHHDPAKPLTMESSIRHTREPQP
ncbi:MAG TPA: TnsA-like heteromeric transposase endonuclease subunit [Candidatus Corynebacterium avicola]|uniref:TnsA-like heteromeric transposase endonuclease subunit n=1 Tax=Candidatus Corynebacterium avicola TaxID=2838527 RepID=A0A9D1RPR2_9CORY|nr:TnsA-like heteromeric transposase endonuclease subunit [Candidatus Corynebacterium avicola]